MNWLDGIIGFISPEWGARREAWRQSLTEMRNYDAGNHRQRYQPFRTHETDRGSRSKEGGDNLPGIYDRAGYQCRKDRNADRDIRRC